jgi:hypothetical protein
MNEARLFVTILFTGETQQWGCLVQSLPPPPPLITTNTVAGSGLEVTQMYLMSAHYVMWRLLYWSARPPWTSKIVRHRQTKWRDASSSSEGNDHPSFLSPFSHAFFPFLSLSLFFFLHKDRVLWGLFLCSEVTLCFRLSLDLPVSLRPSLRVVYHGSCFLVFCLHNVSNLTSH